MRLTFVCTGNICRSAVAERMTRRGLQDWLPGDADQIEVGSAGTAAVVGSAMHPASRRALENRGVPSKGHVAQQLTEEMVADSDVVITMTEEQRATVLALYPRGLKKVFTLREATGLLATLPPVAAPLAHDGESHARALVALLADARRNRVTEPGQDDVPDPIGQPAQAHVEVAQVIEKRLGRLLRAFVQPEFAAELWAPAPVPHRGQSSSSSSSVKNAA
ncbi:protein-tyrosine phosphatase [Klenkia soli]|uniref:Protein-tyrosine phosphatase n=1 Tax=Klenkia soli TaxID=1052260 RepID=A0A1H0UT84_9ACTN|nr:hypothetical protein [Klenkia soli]SDP69333.1 protein-tyrosine phosphatase [Klenkia soli]